MSRIDPDYDVLQSEKDRYERIILRMAENGNYHEAKGDKWTLPLLIGLTLSFVAGGIGTVVTLASLRQEVTDLKEQVTKVEKLVEPRYRGEP